MHSLFSLGFVRLTGASAGPPFSASSADTIPEHSKRLGGTPASFNRCVPLAPQEPRLSLPMSKTFANENHVAANREAARERTYRGKLGDIRGIQPRSRRSRRARLFAADGIGWLATVRRDGSSRLHAIVPIFAAGHWPSSSPTHHQNTTTCCAMAATSCMLHWGRTTESSRSRAALPCRPTRQPAACLPQPQATRSGS